MNNIFGVEVSNGMSLIPCGTYDAVLTGIVQNGVHAREYKGEAKPPAMMIKLIFEIPDLTYKTDDGEMTQTVGKEMPLIVSDRSNFFKYLKAMGIMNEPTNKELGRVFGSLDNAKKLLGTAVSLTIDHFDKPDGTQYHFIESVSKLDPRLPQPEPVRDGFVFIFTEPDLEVFKNNLSAFGRDRIMHSANSGDLPKEFHQFYMAEQEQNKEKKASGGEIL